MSEQAQARRFADRCRTGAAPELVADVGDVAVHRVVAQDQLIGDLLVAQPRRDQRQHLTLSAGEQRKSVQVLTEKLV